MTDSALASHVRSVQTLASEVAAEGRHDAAYKILRDSVAGVLVASRSSPDQKMLKLATRLAEQEDDPSARTKILFQAYDEMLDKSSMNQTTRLPRATTPTSRPPRPLAETPDRPLNSFSPSNPLNRTLNRSGNNFRPVLGSPLPRFNSSLQRDDISPRSDLNLEQGDSQKFSREGLPPAGKSPMKRAASAPYFVPRASGSQPFGDDRISNRGTSHYTTLGAPRTNSHYAETLPGGNWEFGGSINPWRTTHQSFHKGEDQEPLTPCSKDRNFQYVDGEKYNGVASVKQRVKLPAHHRSPYLL